MYLVVEMLIGVLTLNELDMLEIRLVAGRIFDPSDIDFHSLTLTMHRLP